jgi:hypothetical protein
MKNVYITQGKLLQHRLERHRNIITELHHLCKPFDVTKYNIPLLSFWFLKQIRIYEVHKIMPNGEIVSACVHIPFKKRTKHIQLEILSVRPTAIKKLHIIMTKELHTFGFR